MTPECVWNLEGRGKLYWGWKGPVMNFWYCPHHQHSIHLRYPLTPSFGFVRLTREELEWLLRKEE